MNAVRIRTLALCGCMTAALALPCVPVAAQDTAAEPAEAAPEPSAPGDIVVTATRQSQLLSKVPVSISAFSQKTLDTQGIRNVDDVTRFTPGLTLQRNGFGTQASISIRGINSSIGAGTVGVYVDDTPIQTRSIGYSSTNLYPQLFDLERVEVLRGPQGTLFGAGSQGGTVRFITPAPNLSDWHGYGRAELATVNNGGVTYEGGVAVGGPIVDDRVGFRASVSYRRDAGWIDRVTPDFVAANAGRAGFTRVVEEDSNRQGSLIARVALGFRLGDNITVTPSIQYQNTRLRDAYTYWDATSDRSESEFRNGQALRQPDHDKYVLPALRVEFNGPGFDVISNTSWFDRRHVRIDDYTNLIAGLYAGTNNVEVDTAGAPLLPGYRSYANMDNTYRNFTQEVRIQSQDPQARLTWVLGVFYNNLRQRAYEDIVDPQFGALIQYSTGLSLVAYTGFDLINGDLSLIADARTRDRQLAAYGEASFAIVDGLRIRAGARVSQNKFDGSNYATGPFNFATTQDSGRVKETPVTPKVSVEWQANPNNLFYATAAKGFRVGGTNPSIPVAACGADLAARGYDQSPPSYRSDSLWSYEGGVKSKLFGGGTQVAASVYHIDWSNIQQNVYLSGCGLQFTDNLGEVRSDGFDLQVNHRTGPLSLNLAVGYTDARYAKSQFATTGATMPRVRRGNAIEPRPWSVAAGGQYDVDLGGRDGYLRADYTFRGGKARIASQDPGTTSFDPDVLPSETEHQVNVRAGVVFGRLDLSVFANNLLDAHPRLTHYREGADPVFRETTLLPRTIGLTASYRY
jgi:iron complex outermembrane recepter protein